MATTLNINMAEMHIIEDRKDAHPYTFYILLKDRMFQKGKKGYGGSSSGIKFQSLLKGEILFRNRKPAIDIKNTGSIKLYVYVMPSYFCDCHVKDVKEIDEEEARLLLSVSSMDERFRLHIENFLETGKKFTIGTEVWVKVGRQEIPGTIRYKGPLPEEFGTRFGVELMEGKGKGTTDGHFRGISFFQCKTDRGVFVSFQCLTLYKEPMKTNNRNKEMKSNTEVSPAEENITDVFIKVKNRIVEGFTGLLGEQAQEDSSLEKLDKHAGHKLDDRVWVFIEEKPWAGSIKYIGRCPGEREIFAGIELDHSVGMGDGDYDGKQLFTCPRNHANFTPIKNVISKERFSEFFEAEGVPKTSAFKDNSPSSIPQTSEDIVNMESNFSKQSSDEVIKEQEQLLKKIKQEGQKTSEKRSCDGSRAAIGTSLDDYWTSKNEYQTKLNNHVSQATIQVNRDSRPPTSNNCQQMANNSTHLQSDLDVGSMVEVLSKHQKPKYGLIRWLGFIPNSDKKTAGLELEEELDACTDGTFLGKRYFICPNRRGFFVHLHNCLPDSRFNRNSIENPASKRLTGTEFGPYESQIIENVFVPPPETLQVYLEEGARGIQGHHNSCYLDATLFAIFAFSSVMDSILLRPKKHRDIDQYEKVQTVLRNNIIYPLRDSGFVRADRVLELRELLDKLGTVAGLVGEEKDPEEFLLTLLQQVLKSEPFLKIKQGQGKKDIPVNEEYFYQVLADKDVERVLPSVEELLKKSFHQSDLKLTEVPSCLIVQMPRFGKQFKMYDRILPSLTINIGELVDNSPQDCAVCGRLSFFHCRDCFTVTGSEDKDSSGNFCKDCNERVHSHVKRANHKRTPIAVPRIDAKYANRAVEHREMELFAVICIETSHYVTFAKCEEPNGVVRWCFFDSMADRKGTKNGYNVPSVSECPEVIEWLSSEKQNRERIINTNDKEMPDRVRRLLGDAYVCLYQSKEMAMYK